MSLRDELLAASVVCPACHGELARSDSLVCTVCHTPYRWTALNDGRRVPCFVRDDIAHDYASEKPGHWALTTAPDRDSWLSRLRRIIGSGYIPRRAEWEHKRQELLTLKGDATRVLEIGAGGRRLSPTAATLDLFPFNNTDLVADAVALPIRAESFDCVWLECLLEHCPDPQRVTAEAWRVAAPGGAVFAHVPWMLFYHDFPGDYWRFSKEALRGLFPPEAAVEIGVVYGPATAMVSLTAELWARIFTNSDRVWPYGILRALALLVLFPWKYLDAVLVRSPAALRLASTLYAIAHKPTGPGGVHE